MNEWAQFKVPIELPDDPQQRAECEKLLEQIYEENNRWLRRLARLAFMERRKADTAGNVEDSR